MSYGKTKRTPEQMETVCNEIYSRTQGGEVMSRLLKEYGVGPNSYARYRKKLKTSNVVIHNEPKVKRAYVLKKNKVQTTSKVFMFVGSPTELFEVMRGLT